MTKSDTQDEIEFTTDRGLATILLNRPQALHAVALHHVQEIDRKVRQWAEDPSVQGVVVSGVGDRAFCTGGDIRALWQANRNKDSDALRTFFGAEYRLNRRIKTYEKPYVALMDGLTMGGGAGLSVHGSHRVATERTVFAMPETGIGMIPDAGGTYFLPRLPGKVGVYLGLTGARLRAGDCHALGLATHVIPSERLEAVIKALKGLTENRIQDMHAAVTCVLDMYHEDPESAPILRVREKIDTLFAHESVAEIIDALKTDGGDWASRHIDILAQKSPLSLKATFWQLRLGSHVDFDRCMQIEWRVSQRIAMTADFAEGVRALLIDKDKAPKWSAASVRDVAQADVDALFAPLEGADLSVE